MLPWKLPVVVQMGSGLSHISKFRGATPDTLDLSLHCPLLRPRAPPTSITLSAVHTVVLLRESLPPIWPPVPLTTRLPFLQTGGGGLGAEASPRSWCPAFEAQAGINHFASSGWLLPGSLCCHGLLNPLGLLQAPHCWRGH